MIPTSETGQVLALVGLVYGATLLLENLWMVVLVGAVGAMVMFAWWLL